jgi:hypothetical protein
VGVYVSVGILLVSVVYVSVGVGVYVSVGILLVLSVWVCLCGAHAQMLKP